MALPPVQFQAALRSLSGSHAVPARSSLETGRPPDRYSSHLGKESSLRLGRSGRKAGFHLRRSAAGRFSEGANAIDWECRTASPDLQPARGAVMLASITAILGPEHRSERVDINIVLCASLHALMVTCASCADHPVELPARWRAPAAVPASEGVQRADCGRSEDLPAERGCSRCGVIGGEYERSRSTISPARRPRQPPASCIRHRGRQEHGATPQLLVVAICAELGAQLSIPPARGFDTVAASCPVSGDGGGSCLS
jgi:hypothetical protein